MEQKAEVIEVASLHLPDPITKYHITPAKVAELAKKYDGLTVKQDDPKSYRECTSAKMELVHVRTAVDKRRLENNKEAQDYITKNNSAAKQLLAPLAPVEDRLKSELKAEDDRLEAIEAEKIRKNQDRIDNICKMIEGIKSIPLSMIGKSAAVMQEQLDLVLKWELTETEFQEFLDEAQEVKSLVLDTLNNQRLNRIEMDREDTERKAEAERLEKVRLEQEAEALRLEEVRKAQEDEQRASREYDEARRREKEERLAADRKAFEDEQRRVREEHEAKLRAEDERIAADRKAFEDEQRRVREEHEAKLRAEDERIAAARRQLEEEAARIEAEKKAEQERKDREEFERKAKEEAQVKAEQEAKRGKYKVTLEWSGYSRGTSVYIVDASSKEEAKESWYEGERISHEVIRDDTNKDVLEIQKL